jgi:hypothetical protein
MASQRIPPGMIMALILTAIPAVVFTVLTVVKTSDVRRFQEGDPERASFTTLPKLRTEKRTSEQSIEALRGEVGLRRAEVERLDIQLAKHGVYRREDFLYIGVAAPGKEVAPTVAGPATRLRDGAAATARISIDGAAQRIEAQKAEYAGPDRQTFPALEQTIRNRQDELTTINQRITTADAGFQKDRNALTEQLDALNKQRDEEDRRQRQETSTRLTKISQLEDGIRKLLQTEFRYLAELDPIGSVLAIEEHSDRIIVDLGSEERAFPGLILEVFTRNRGAYLAKGRLEVIEVQAGISVCRILEVVDARRFPIARDDRIANPVFDKRRAREFVLAGDFSRYARADLATFIRKSGGVVREKVGPGVDYLVVGKRADDVVAQAREFDIRGLTEEQLLRYVQPNFGTP